MPRRRRWWWGVVAVALGLIAWRAAPTVTSAAFVLDLAGRTDWPRRLLPVRVHDVRTENLTVPTRHGPIAARVYAPVSGTRDSILVVPGIHAGGLDEPRLVTFARRLAGTGTRVLSLPLPDLRAFRITPRSTDMIEDAAVWMAADPRLAPTGRISLGGVSFAGGLAIVAAGRPSLAGKLQLVVSIGGHGDLPRVMQFVCAGRNTDVPHDYGVAVLLLAAAPHVVPPEQTTTLERAVAHYLQAGSVSATDAAATAAELDATRTLGESMPEPGRTYVRWMLARDVTALGAVLQPFIAEIGSHPALSPERSPPPQAPVFLLHGDRDPVIPTDETPRTAGYLRAHGPSPVRLLVTPLLTHADIRDRASASDFWALVSFWRDVLTTARAR